MRRWSRLSAGGEERLHLVVLGAVLLGEEIEGRLGISPGPGLSDVAQAGLYGRDQGSRELVRQVGSLVDPGSLVVCRESRRRAPSGTRERHRRRRSPARRRRGHTFPRSTSSSHWLRPHAHADLEADKLPAAPGRRADDDEHALDARFHAGPEADGVGLDADVAAGGETSALPALVRRLPPGRAPHDDARGVFGRQG